MAPGAAPRRAARVLSSGALTEAYIEDLKLFRFSTHPKIAPKIEEMKTEITKYNSLVKSIKPLPQRLDPKGNDTFSLLCFWRANEGEGRPSPTCFMLCSPTPPTRSRRSVSSFSVLNDTFDDDMASSLADYIELSLQLQFNSRSRSDP